MSLLVYVYQFQKYIISQSGIEIFFFASVMKK